MVFSDSAGYEREFIAGESMRNDKDSRMRTMLIEELNSEADKIISVAGYKTSAFRYCPFKLLSVSSLLHTNLVGADCINMILSKDFRNLWTEVFIKIIFQRLPLTRKGYLL